VVGSIVSFYVCSIVDIATYACCANSSGLFYSQEASSQNTREISTCHSHNSASYQKPIWARTILCGYINACFAWAGIIHHVYWHNDDELPW
jgi:hypothetical protein